MSKKMTLVKQIFFFNINPKSDASKFIYLFRLMITLPKNFELDHSVMPFNLRSICCFSKWVNSLTYQRTSSLYHHNHLVVHFSIFWVRNNSFSFFFYRKRTTPKKQGQSNILESPNNQSNNRVFTQFPIKTID